MRRPALRSRGEISEQYGLDFVIGLANQLFGRICRLSDSLFTDQDDMVQKGLGWKVRETAKVDAERILPYLIKNRNKTSRLVLRPAHETLPKKTKRLVLSRGSARSIRSKPRG